MKNILTPTAVLLDMSEDEVKYQLHLMQIASKNYFDNTDEIIEGFFDDPDKVENVGEKGLELYFQHHLVEEKGLNALLCRAFTHCSWWDDKNRTPSDEEVLTEVHYLY